MSRRAFLLLFLGLVAAAIVPWTTSSARLTNSVVRQMRAAYGVDLSVAGRTTIAFLPTPRVKFSDIALQGEGGAALASGGQLRAEIRLLPLLAGRFELVDLAFNAMRIEVALDERGRSAWDPLLARLRAQAAAPDDQPLPVRRIAVTASQLVISGAQGGATHRVDALDLVVRWPSPAAAIAASAQGVWRDEQVSVTLSELRPALLLAGRDTLFALEARTRLGTLAVSGQRAADGRLSGQSAIHTASLRDFSRWSGLDLPLGGQIQGFGLEGAFTSEGSEASWPNVRLTLGTDRLDGSLSVQTGTARPLVRATLAGSQVDLTGLTAPLRDLRAPEGPWISDPFTPGMASAGDLDLRLSAGSARIGRLKLDDLAAALLLNPARMELSLGRAGLDQGVLKGRIAAGIGSGFFDLKGQVTFDKVDVAALLADLGSSPWLSGTAQGHLVVEGFGESPADLIRQLNGRALLNMRDMEISGIALEELLRRPERRALSTPLEWRGGRTAFERVQVPLAIVNGVAELGEATLTSPRLKTLMRGRLSLADRSLDLRVTTEAAAGTLTSIASQPPSLAFDIAGPWENPRVAPALDAPVRRSDVARP
jgi:AsmA protein